MAFTADEEMKVRAVLQAIQLAPGVVRICPTNPDGTPHQRMAIGPTGVSISDNDPDPTWAYSGNLFVSGRLGVQTCKFWNLTAEAARKSLSFLGKLWQEGFPAAFSVEPNNIPDQVAGNIWQSGHADDGLTDYGLLVTTADSSRPHSRNTALRLDAVNDQGEVGATVTAIELNAFGGDPDTRAIDVSGSSSPTTATIYTGVVDTSTMTNAQYITYLYQTLLHRQPDALGLQLWTQDLNTMSRDQVKAAIMATPEYQSLHP